ncbi:7273_t:CDS:2 [Funneliformis caledonium]|uniref:7273_t:CDS:1 n=1 Tax=Funneliformis caledonium TaxID=1117310 RepID=A0A9N8ZIL0_9GLOM|nr:7273_t:CDS:2 [Funneliformis caledonium]
MAAGFEVLEEQLINDWKTVLSEGVTTKTIRAFYPVADLLEEEINALVDASSSNSRVVLLDFPAPSKPFRQRHKWSSSWTYMADGILSCLNANFIYASVDAGACYGSKGYIDFYVDDKKKWAIELLRDGDRLLEHQ